MQISQQKEVQLEKILNQMTNILMPNNFGAQMSEVRQFLKCAYNLFRSLESSFKMPGIFSSFSRILGHMYDRNVLL